MSARTAWLVLFLSCVVQLGSYYAYDVPAAMHDQLRHFFEEIPTDRFEVLFNLLYTVYSIPNIVLPFFGGHLVDAFGTAQMVLFFSTLTAVGQLVHAWACGIRLEGSAGGGRIGSEAKLLSANVGVVACCAKIREFLG